MERVQDLAEGMAREDSKQFRIVDPLAFVRVIGTSNFDLVLSSAVQDATRQRSRQVSTDKAYDLRGSDVGDMQDYLNHQLTQYGVRILGANIPDVQLPDQYQQHLSTRERVAKVLARRRVEIGEKLMQRAPRPVLIRGEGGEQSALSTLLLARLLPQLTENGNTVDDASQALRDIGDG